MTAHAELDPGARTLAAGELEAVFLPGQGMLGGSLRHGGEELLGLVGDLARLAEAGSTAGIPLLHPWANRLEGLGYEAAGRAVHLSPGSPLLHLDGNGLPIHGVPWSRLGWTVVEERPDRVRAVLDWARGDLLAVFPFPHRLELGAALDPAGLTIATELTPVHDVAVPVAFGFHPYLRLPGVPREAWRLELPAMTRLVTDGRGIPTGEEEPFAGLAGPLDRDYDDGFAGLPERPEYAVSGGGRRIVVTFLAGYAYAQVFAPPGQELVCFEPMTAPTNALASGRGLRLVEPGASFRASFRIAVELS